MLPTHALAQHERQLRDIFTSTYGTYGGYWPHVQDFYDEALRSVIFAEMLYRISLLLLGSTSDPKGYAIVGSLPDQLAVLEIATCEADTVDAGQLLQHIAALARQSDQKIGFSASTLHPLAPVLRHQG